MTIGYPITDTERYEVTTVITKMVEQDSTVGVDDILDMCLLDTTTSNRQIVINLSHSMGYFSDITSSYPDGRNPISISNIIPS